MAPRSSSQSITVTAQDREPLDRLIWRVLGRTSGALEPVLLANPGVAAVADALPQGAEVVIDLGLGARPARSAPLIQLWD